MKFRWMGETGYQTIKSKINNRSLLVTVVLAANLLDLLCSVDETDMRPDAENTIEIP